MSLKAKLTALAEKFNKAFSQLPAKEQYKESDAAYHGMVSLAECRTEAAALIGEFDAEITAAKADGEKAGKDAILASNEYVKKSDHDAAVTAAVETAKKQVKDEFEARAQEVKQAEDARAKLVSDKVVPAVMAAKLPQSALVGDKAQALAEKAKGRAAELTKLGLDPEKNGDAFAAAAESIEDDASFTKTLAIIASARVGVTAEKVKTGGKPNPVAGGDDKKKASYLI